MGITDYKALILGNTGSGKTRLLGGIVDEPYPEISEVMKTNVKKPNLDGNKELYLFEAILDCNGQVHRPFFIDCDLSIVVFSVDDLDSFRNIESVWMSQIRRRVPNKPVILIGNKLDLRSDPETIFRLSRLGNRPVSYEEGCNMATKIGAIIYIECSAEHNINVQLVTQSILETLEKYDEHKQKEVIEDNDTCICRIS